MPPIPIAASRLIAPVEIPQLVVNQRDTVEPVDVLRAPISIHPDARRFHDLAALRPRHGLERAAECRAAARFDFKESHQVTPPGDEVQLDAADPEAVRHDVPSAALEVLDRLLFTGESSPMAGICPTGRIAVHSARHEMKLRRAAVPR